MSLTEYRRKRDFAVTREPPARLAKGSGPQARFVIQKHDASRLHYDFRLELGGTLISWAVPKGMPMAKGEKRLAIKVEDHPVSYIDFEGTIPKGQYGGGTVQIWDRGTYEPLSKSPKKELAGGKLHFVLTGHKLSGEWYLVRLKDEEQWLIIRGGEDHPKLSKEKQDLSALSGKTLAELSKGNPGGNSSVKVPKKKPKPKLKTTPALIEAEFIEPMKAKSADGAPSGDWLYEVKLDGFRAVTYLKGGAVRLLSRTNHDLAAKFPEVVEAFQEFTKVEAIWDGEIVALDPKGRSSFQLLQAYELGQERPPLRYYVFDLLSLRGKSLVHLPLEERRGKLEKLLATSSGMIRFSPTLGSESGPLLKQAKKLGLEGLIGKRSCSLYESGRRSGAWIKLKLVKQQEFVIGGYTEPSGARQHMGALLVGVYEKNKLVYAGKVGTGFSAAVLSDLAEQFGEQAQKTCPFSDLPEERVGRYGQGITAAVMKKCHWIKPTLVCELKFAEWTKDKRLRQPVYLGLREDKEPAKVIREAASLP